MLILEINDARLEQKILEKARTIGKSVQELLNDFVVEKIREDEQADNLPFDVPKLDYRKHIKIIDYDLKEGEGNVDDSPLFQNEMDTVEFAKQLRKQAWERKS